MNILKKQELKGKLGTHFYSTPPIQDRILTASACQSALGAFMGLSKSAASGGQCKNPLEIMMWWNYSD